jgi:hypothetical protein
MEPEARRLGKALVNGPVPSEAMRLAEIYAYFPGVRLASQEEVDLLNLDYDSIPGVDQDHPAFASAQIPEGSAQPGEEPYVESETFKIPKGPRGGGGVARENVQEKGRRMLTEGRLTVEYVSSSADERAPIMATCKGDSGEVYDLGYRADQKRWGCTCEARGECAHLVALKLVTVKP